MRIERLRLLSPAPADLCDFFCAAFGASRWARGVALGQEIIEIAPAPSGGEVDFLAYQTGFQHFAIVVSDMAAAYTRLGETGGWRAISLAGPERLPAASGGAAAFKFRDPNGHPLELLQFPENRAPDVWRARFQSAPDLLFHGVDHTAITVSDAEASVAFYAGVGFTCAHRQVNAGAEQRRLDGLLEDSDAQVEIVSLSPPGGARPGVELLAYRKPAPQARPAADGSVAATEILLSDRSFVAPRDPDGHRLAAASGGSHS